MAYINWKEQKNGVPLRLFTRNEFETIRGNKEGLTGNGPKENVLGINIRETKEEDMDVVEKGFGGLNTFVRFPNEFKWDVMEDGTKFIPLYCFAEWVMENTCVRSGDLSSFYGNDCFRGMSLSTTGAYKSTKIGFRLCYEIEHEE
jgi:hypothetical protein